MTISTLMATYPRTRPSLKKEFERIYVSHYKKNRGGGSFLQKSVLWMESWMHRNIGRRAAADDKILEIGAGTLNHLPFEPNSLIYDVIEPFRELYGNSARLCKVNNLYADITAVPSDARYDRIVSVAVLEHVEDLPGVIARAALLLNNGGCFQAGIPSEGGFLWGLSWRATTGIEFRIKTGLDYGVLMRWEHINTADEIEMLIHHFFRTVRIRRFPLNLRHGSLYTLVEALGPHHERSRRYLVSRTPA